MASTLHGGGKRVREIDKEVSRLRGRTRHGPGIRRFSTGTALLVLQRPQERYNLCELAPKKEIPNQMNITRRSFIAMTAATSAQGSLLAANSHASVAATSAIRMGGPIFLESNDPAVLAREHRRLGYLTPNALDTCRQSYRARLYGPANKLLDRQCESR